MSSKKISLSASKIKTLSSCGMLFFFKYHLHAPSKSNSGASRGSCAHKLLECLLNKRHKNKYFDKILKNNTIYRFPALKRLVKKHASKLGVDDPDNLEMIESFVMVGLRHDFYCNGCNKLEVESEFRIEGNNYSICGFIDKKAIYPDGSIKIVDYKGTKAKFSKDELDDNLQWFMYSLATFKIDKIIPDLSFLFLKFANKPEVNMPKCTEQQLKGFEKYLEYIADYLSNFTIEEALSNLAANDYKHKWLCGKDLPDKFCCEARRPFDYYVSLSDEGKIIKSAFEEKDLQNEKKVEKRHYSGCPHWNKTQEFS